MNISLLADVEESLVCKLSVFLSRVPSCFHCTGIDVAQEPPIALTENQFYCKESAAHVALHRVGAEDNGSNLVKW